MDDSDSVCGQCRLGFAATGISAMIEAQPGFVHHGPQALKDSADSGCASCSLVLEAIGLCIDDGNFENAVIIAEEDEAGDASSVKTLSVWPYPRRNESGDILSMELSVFCAEGSPIGDFFPLRPAQHDVMLPQVILQAKQLIDECESTHAQCFKPALSRLPTRVVDLGDLESSSAVKLHITDPAGECGRYVTLSYCWGGPQPVTATKPGLQRLVDGIPLEQLPQTLRDAVRVTAALGLRYLWIDALCILQDDADDKRAEIGKMGDIYRNSSVTIAAGVAETVYDGFLAHPREEPPCGVPAQAPRGGPWGELFLAHTASADFGDLPLSTRGWTLQEWLLSPRVLLYGEQELVFQCRTRGSRAVCASYVSYDEVNANPSRIVDYGDQAADPAARARLWRAFIAEYTRRKLSVPEDRVHAMAGVTGVLASQWRDECAFGLWRSILPMALAWSCIPTSQPAPTGRTGRAPSWSWLSVETSQLLRVETLYLMGGGGAGAQVLDVDGWAMRLRCRVIPPGEFDIGRFYYEDIRGEGAGKTALCLFLGVLFEFHDETHGQGLVVTADESGVFRRLGLIRLTGQEWLPYAMQEVTVM